MQVVVSRSTYKGSPEAFTQINKILCRGDIIGNCQPVSMKNTDASSVLTYSHLMPPSPWYAAVSGLPGKTNHGQLSIYATDRLELLSPCLHDIPKSKLNDAVSGLVTGRWYSNEIFWHGFKGKRFRNRHVDLLTNPEAIETLRTRSQVRKPWPRFFLN
jgi:lysyl-tRNA synthetase class 2